MICYASALAAPAEKAGIAVPPDCDNYSREEYPHFFVYCSMQLDSPMPESTSHWTNATVVAALSLDRVKTITPEEIEALGFRIGHAIP